MMENIYEIKNLEFSYLLAGQPFQILSIDSLKIPAKSLITISGPSGSGKSTLLHLLGLIEPVQKGSLLFDGEDLRNMPEKRKNELRKFKLGLIFQQFHLIPVLTAEENVKYFLARQHLSKKEIHTRTQDTLYEVGLWEHRMKKPNQLSGGQQQRVAIARALAKRPGVILADEPTASLDRKTGIEIMDLLKKMVANHGCSIVISTHDTMVRSYADQNFSLQDGLLL